VYSENILIVTESYGFLNPQQGLGSRYQLLSEHLAKNKMNVSVLYIGPESILFDQVKESSKSKEITLIR